MSTVAQVQDLEKLQRALAEVRSDADGVERKAWCIVGHVDNQINEVDVLHEDTSNGATMEGFLSHLEDDQVMYCLLRLTASVDMSTTVKFVYVHWCGEKVPFAKKGRYGVVHGSVQEHFNPFHLMIETGNRDELDEQELIKLLDDSTGKSNKVLNDVAGRQERGFTAHQVKRETKGHLRTIAPEGAKVDTTPELNQAIGDVRSDVNATSWILAGFEDGNLKKPLTVLSQGEGGIDELAEKLEDDLVMYGLYRTTDVIDEITTVKFVYIYWIGDKTKPLTKGKVSAYSGPIEKVFSPAHATLSFTNRYDITEDIIRDKVMAGSGSKSFVK